MDDSVLPGFDSSPNNLDAFWMPFTPQPGVQGRSAHGRRAEGMYYYTPDGREILDGTAGLWCVNAGHGRAKIVEAIRRQAGDLDYAPTFKLGHPLAFEFANRLAGHAARGLDRVFFTNSGSESADTALKIALAYHRARGEAARTRLIGRERGYHGVNFGGISVGGIGREPQALRPAAARRRSPAAHPRPDAQRLLQGQPAHGAEFADALERLVALHDATTIAAVIVEPVAGSTGVLVPPKGYLERLRELCTKHDILLIFDEVITGFGRLGAPLRRRSTSA